MRSWYVVYSKPRKELFAQEHLRRRGVEVLFPQLLLPRYVRGRQRIVPMFPSYLFVHLSVPDQYHAALWSPGVRGFVGCRGVPTPVEETVVAFLQRQETGDGVIAASSGLSVGQEVQIERGPLAGVIGIIQQPPSSKGRVKVLMQLLNERALRVDVPVAWVNAAWGISRGVEVRAQ